MAIALNGARAHELGRIKPGFLASAALLSDDPASAIRGSMADEDALKLVGAVTEGSGAVNEDGWGCSGSSEDVSAAWVFDGVTGINERQYMPGASDAAWLVARAQAHLKNLAGGDLEPRHIVERLVQGLIEDWRVEAAGIEFPAGYDPPAACLVLAKRYGGGWQAARLGDSCLFARGKDRKLLAIAPNNDFDHWLSKEARKRRDAGVLDVQALLAEFRPLLLKGRAARNQPGGYGILEADMAATRFVEYFDLGTPGELLLCTDGYYRAVDHYGIHSDESLMAASLQHGGVGRVLGQIRAIESSDPLCEKYSRFKPADDATAAMMKSLT